MITPWGKADYPDKLTHGVYSVDTPSHGGVLIGKRVARKLLSPRALTIGQPFGAYLAYEEDCDMAVVMYEKPEWFVEIIRRHPPAEEIKQRAAECLERWHPEYFQVDAHDSND